MSSPVVETLRVLAPVLDGVVDGWYLIGAQAALSRRLSSDIDITVLSEHESPRALVANLQAAGFELRVPDIEDFVAVTRVLPVVYSPTQMPVDLVFGGPDWKR